MTEVTRLDLIGDPTDRARVALEIVHAKLRPEIEFAFEKVKCAGKHRRTMDVFRAEWRVARWRTLCHL